MIRRSPAVLVVSPCTDVRDASVYLEAIRHGHTQLVVPRSSAQWPSGGAVRQVAVRRGNQYTQMWIRGLKQLISETRPDLIHVHNEPWAVTSIRVLRSGIPTVLHGGENIMINAPLPTRLRRVGMSRSLRRCAGYVSWGRTGIEAALRAGLPTHTPRAVIPASPPDPAVFRERPIAITDAMKVVFVGRLVAEKGVDTLLDAIGSRSRRLQFDLVIVGEGPELGRLRARAAELGIRARFVGRLDVKGTQEAIASSNVVVVPSIDTRVWSEQWGRVVMEAMMTGRSVLASDAGELPHLVGNPEWMFRQGSAESLGQRLDELLDAPSLLVARGREALDRSRRFHPRLLAGQLAAFWDEALAFSAGDRRIGEVGDV